MVLPKAMAACKIREKTKQKKKIHGNVRKKQAGNFCYLSQPIILIKSLGRSGPPFPFAPTPTYAGAAIRETIL